MTYGFGGVMPMEVDALEACGGPGAFKGHWRLSTEPVQIGMLVACHGFYVELLVCSLLRGASNNQYAIDLQLWCWCKRFVLTHGTTKMLRLTWNQDRRMFRVKHGQYGMCLKQDRISIDINL